MARKKKPETEQADLGLTVEAPTRGCRRAEAVARVRTTLTGILAREDSDVPVAPLGRDRAVRILNGSMRWEVWAHVGDVGYCLGSHQAEAAAIAHATRARPNYPEKVSVGVFHRTPGRDSAKHSIL